MSKNGAGDPDCTCAFFHEILDIGFDNCSEVQKIMFGAVIGEDLARG